MHENEYIPHEKENPFYDDEPTSSDSGKKRKTVKAEKSKSPGIKSVPGVGFFKSPKLISTIGALLLMGSVFLFISCISYFMTWKNDQDALINFGFWDYILNKNIAAPENWLGKIGAWTGHSLIYGAFGITSLGICLLLFIYGIRILFKTELLPLGKTTMIVISYMLWGSIFLGFFANYLNFIGGTFGFFINEWLVLSIGTIGTIIFHFVLLYIITTVVINPNYASWLEKFKPKNLEGDFFQSEDENNSNVYENMDVVNSIHENDIEKDIISAPVHFGENEYEFEDENNTISNVPLEEESTSELEITYSPQEPLVEQANDVSENQSENTSASNHNPYTSTEDQVAERLVQEYGLYDPKKDLESYQLPPLELLREYGGNGVSVSKEELEGNKDKIVQTLSHYKIDIAKIKATVGPTVTLYEIVPAPGVRISKIKNLEDDIALSLSALGIRIIAPIPGKGTIGIEVPNSNPEMVSMKSLIASEKFQNMDAELPIVMGKTITNETFVFDLTKMPHLLVAGATGQGKSVGLNAILISILYKKHPAQVKFVLVDPKKVELTLYNKIERHYLAKLPGEGDAIIVDTSKVVNTLNSLCIEMDDRYELLKNAGVRTIKEYNVKFIERKLNPEKGHKYLPYIVVLIDEFADLIMTAGKEIEHPIARIAQLARAIGIHLIVATQRPSVNVITGMIKANFPARIAFRVLSKIDSRTILDGSGADQLIGKGDMLISTGSDMLRLQCGFVDTPEVDAICGFIGEQRAYPSAFILPEYVNEDSDSNGEIDMNEIDPMFVDSARIVVINQQGSASLLQRKLKLGYNRAGRIVDQLESMGIIGGFQGSKARDVLFNDIESLDEFLKVKGIL